MKQEIIEYLILASNNPFYKVAISKSTEHIKQDPNFLCDLSQKDIKVIIENNKESALKSLKYALDIATDNYNNLLNKIEEQKK